MKKAIKAIMYITVTLLFGITIVFVCIAAISDIENSEIPGDSTETTLPNESTKPTNPSEPTKPTNPNDSNGSDDSNVIKTKHRIDVFRTGDGSNLTKVDIECPESAEEGEAVTFTVGEPPQNWHISEITVSWAVPGQGYKIYPERNGNEYTFEMPGAPVTIYIDLTYSPPADVKNYRIAYDVLGSYSWVEVECPSQAAEGETVTFRLTLTGSDKDRYAISDVVIQDEEGEWIYTFRQSGEGAYTFTMFSQDVTILIYTVLAEYA